MNGLALGSGRSESLLVYRDRAQIPSYAIEPVAAATQRELIVSYPNPYQLRPLDPITRAETAALVHQALVAAGTTPRLASPFISQAAAAAANFTDLSARHWAKSFIDPLVQKGWLSGFSRWLLSARCAHDSGPVCGAHRRCLRPRASAACHFLSRCA